MTDKIVRSKEEIEEMLEAMRQQLENLPDYNIWNESTVADQADISRDINLLERFVETSELPSDPWSEVYGWLTGQDWSFLEDYLL